MVGLPYQLADRLMLCGGNHAFVDLIAIGVERGLFAIPCRDDLSQLFGTLATAAPYVEGNNGGGKCAKVHKVSQLYLTI